MKQKLHDHFVKFGPRRFVVTTVLILILTDLLNGYYLKLYWMAKNVSESLVITGLKRGGGVLEEITPSTMREMTGFVDNSFYFFLFVILVNNLFFYFFYLRQKLWAQGFVLFYTLSAAFFSITFIFDDVDLGFAWMLYNILTIPLYLYLFLGVKVLKHETTSLVSEK